LRDIRSGETLVVVRLDRLARSVSHLLAVIEQLGAAGAHFRSLRDPIDTSTPQGMFSLQVLGAVAQLERALIAERTKSGLNAARARGRVGGNPGLRAGDPKAIRKLRAGRDAAHLEGVLARLDTWLPTVRRMRPDQPWGRCCTDRRIVATSPYPHLASGNTDGDRASQLQHAVQDIDGDTNFGGATLVLMKARPIVDHLFISADGGLYPAACRIARRLLPADPAFVGDALQMAVALCGRGLSRLAQHRRRACGTMTAASRSRSLTAR
jgi:Resolvase, N terminal domain